MSEPSIVIPDGQQFSIRQPCPAPAPLVVNGAVFVGCAHTDGAGHDGNHEVTIRWTSS